ncbi:MAG: DHA2 family efflux MFS transporter permease subunit [Anaerolineae bacterium]
MASYNIPVPETKTGGWSLAYQWQALIVVVIGSFMVMLDTTAVNIALPKIINVFGASVDSAQFVLTGYMLALAIVMPTAGYLTETYGTKRVYMLSMLFFTLGSLLCGLSWNVQSLVFFRILQGFGGGLLTPLGMTIIFRVTPPAKRGMVTGLYGLPLLLAPVIGPTLGGYIVQYYDWRFIFTMNLPIGIIGMAMAWMMLRETERVPHLHFDTRGFFLSAFGFASILYALATAPGDGWTTPLNLTLMVTGSIALVLWVFVELTETHPLLDLRVFKNRTYSLATSVTFIVTLGMFSSTFLLPLFLQDFRGLTPFQSGLLLFPQALAAGMMMPITGRLFDRLGPRPLIVTGLMLMAFATWQLSDISMEMSNKTLYGILMIRGVAMGMVTMPAITVGMNTLPHHLVARGSALTNVMRQLFGAFGTAIFASLLTSRMTYHTAMLKQVVTPDSPVVRSTIAALMRYATHEGAGALQSKVDAVYSLYMQLINKAAVMSFDDCFRLAAIICAFGVIPALFLKSKGHSHQPGETAEAVLME